MYLNQKSMYEPHLNCFFPKTKAIQLKTSMFFIIVDIDSRYLKRVNSKCNMYITHRL